MKPSRMKQALAAVLALVGLALPGVGAQAQTLYVYNWSEYMDPDIIRDFEKKYDVKVSESYFNSNPELFAKLRSGGVRQYDVVIPSSYYVARLAESNLLQPLDKAQLPNLKNLEPRFANPDYDPDNTYSVPYQWGDTGIVYNTRKLPDLPHTWAALFDPKVNPNQAFTMIVDPQVQIGAACAYLGTGYNCQSRDDWVAAAKLVLQTKKRKNFNGFLEGTPTLNHVARGNAALGLTFNGDYVFQKREDPKTYADMAFFIPEEGSELWVDTMAIPAHAPHPELAHKFINYLLEPEVGARLSNYNAYTSPNAAAQPFLDEELTDPPITPTEEDMKRLAFTPGLAGEDLQFLQQLWTQIQSE